MQHNGQQTQQTNKHSKSILKNNTQSINKQKQTQNTHNIHTQKNMRNGGMRNQKKQTHTQKNMEKGSTHKANTTTTT